MATYEDKPSLAAWNALASPWVKLVDYTVPSDTAQVNLDVSGIDFYGFERIEFGLYSLRVFGVDMRINGLTNYTYSSGSTATELATYDNNGRYRNIFFPPSVYGYITCLRFTDTSTTPTIVTSTCYWNTLKTINLIYNGNGFTHPYGKIPAETRFTLFGLAK